MNKTKKSIRIPRIGKPVAKVVPSGLQTPKDWLGSMKDEIKILGDIVSPANELEDWNALRD